MFIQNRRTALALVLLAIGLIAVGGLIGGWLDGRLGDLQAAHIRAPINIFVDGSLQQTTIDERLRKATIVVQGTVGESLPGRWNTSTGSLPANVTVQTMPSDTLIFTDTPIKVERVLKGSVASDTVLVRTLGGAVDQDRMEVEYAPELHPGKQVVLLLVPDDDSRTMNIGPEHYIVAFGFEGSYDVVGDQAVSRTHQLPLADLQKLIRDNTR